MQNNLVATSARRFAGYCYLHRRKKSFRGGIIWVSAHSQSGYFEQFPLIGRIVPEEQDENIREIIFPPYRVIYKILLEHQAVAISRVWHGARGAPEIPSHSEY